MPQSPPAIDGLLDEPRRLPGGDPYRGRFSLPDPRWVVNPQVVYASATLSLEVIADAALSNLLWTDQDVQRGIKEEAPSGMPVQLPLSAGYLDQRFYVFDPSKADNMAEKLLSGRQPYLDPLQWNLRPGAFQAYWDEAQRELYIYEGRIYLPDSHHRHQALVKALQIFRGAENDYPNFDPTWQFTVDLYFVSRDGEKEYFFEKNVLGRAPDTSKSYDLTQQDPLAVMAKRFAELTPVLQGNVNRVTDRLSASNPQVVTLSTLHAMMETLAGTKEPTDRQLERLAETAAELYTHLAEVRPELGKVDLDARREYREKSMAAQAVLMHGFAHLMRAFSKPPEGTDEVKYRDSFLKALGALAAEEIYKDQDGWEGDFFDRENPLWQRIGVLQRTSTGRLTVSNTRQTREQAGRVLLERLAL
jgi:DNA-sulfur modification-associated